MLEVTETAEKIQDSINKLQLYSGKLKEVAQKRAVAISEYDKQVAKIIMTLKNGGEVEFEGEVITKPAATIMDKLTKGICWRERLEMEKADSAYKNCLTIIKVEQSVLQGYQSINKFLGNL